MKLFKRAKKKIIETIQSDDDGWKTLEELDIKDDLKFVDSSEKMPEYAKINLLDTGLIKEGGRVYDLLQKREINTVGQILNDTLMEEVKKSTTYPENIDILISFIKNKYEGVPLPRTRLLEEKVKGDKNIIFDIFGVYACNPNEYNFDYLECFEEAKKMDF